MLPFILQTFHLADLQCLFVSIEAESSRASLSVLPDLLIGALVETYCPCRDDGSFLSFSSQCLIGRARVHKTLPRPWMAWSLEQP